MRMPMDEQGRFAYLAIERGRISTRQEKLLENECHRLRECLRDSYAMQEYYRTGVYKQPLRRFRPDPWDREIRRPFRSSEPLPNPQSDEPDIGICFPIDEEGGIGI